MNVDVNAVLLGSIGALALWDAARRHIAARRYNQQMLDKLDKFERELEKQGGQIQAVMGKVNATGAAVATRSGPSLRGVTR